MEAREIPSYAYQVSLSRDVIHVIVSHMSTSAANAMRLVWPWLVIGRLGLKPGFDPLALRLARHWASSGQAALLYRDINAMLDVEQCHDASIRVQILDFLTTDVHCVAVISLFVPGCHYPKLRSIILAMEGSDDSLAEELYAQFGAPEDISMRHLVAHVDHAASLDLIFRWITKKEITELAHDLWPLVGKYSATDHVATLISHSGRPQKPLWLLKSEDPVFFERFYDDDVTALLDGSSAWFVWPVGCRLSEEIALVVGRRATGKHRRGALASILYNGALYSPTWDRFIELYAKEAVEHGSKDPSWYAWDYTTESLRKLVSVAGDVLPQIPNCPETFRLLCFDDERLALYLRHMRYPISDTVIEDHTFIARCLVSAPAALKEYCDRFACFLTTPPNQWIKQLGNCMLPGSTFPIRRRLWWHDPVHPFLIALELSIVMQRGAGMGLRRPTDLASNHDAMFIYWDTILYVDVSRVHFSAPMTLSIRRSKEETGTSFGNAEDAVAWIVDEYPGTLSCLTVEKDILCSPRSE